MGQQIDYRGSSFEDLDRLIRSEVTKACRSFNIDQGQHGEDLLQVGWLIVLRKLPVYKDMGFKVTTYLFPYIRRDVRGEAFKITRRHRVQPLAEDEFFVQHHSDPGELHLRDVDWADLHEYVLLHASGYTDDEIIELTGDPNAPKVRQEAARALQR